MPNRFRPQVKLNKKFYSDRNVILGIRVPCYKVSPATLQGRFVGGRIVAGKLCGGETMWMEAL